MHGETHDEQPAPPTTGQKVAAELFGTLVLVFFGVGAWLMSRDYVTTGLAFGLTVLVMATAVGRISGGHFNPAVTLGAALGGRLAWRDTPLYVVAQLAGAVLAGGLLFAVMHGFPGYDVSLRGLGQNGFGAESANSYAWWAALLLEALLTLLFVWVILGATDSRNASMAAVAPVAIGMMLTLVHFASMAATGTSVNPARSIGVGLFAGLDAILQLWLFILAPLLGGAIAGLTYPLIFGQGAATVPGSGIARRQRPEQPAHPAYGLPGPGTPWGGLAGQPQPGQQAPWGGAQGWPQHQPPPHQQPPGGAAETQVRPAPGGQWPQPGPGTGVGASPRPEQPQPQQQQQPPHQQSQGGHAQAPHQPPHQPPYPGGVPWGASPPDDDEGHTQVRPGG